MATVYDPSLGGLDDRGGCSGVSPETPVSVQNRAGV